MQCKKQYSIPPPKSTGLLSVYYGRCLRLPMLNNDLQGPYWEQEPSKNIPTAE